MAEHVLDTVLYRIGRSPDPLHAPAGTPKNTGSRFDDPDGQFYALYAAEQRQACFLETLARFRPDLELLAALRALPQGDFGDTLPDAGIIPDDWHLKRMIGSFQVSTGQRWLDLRTIETREQMRRILAATLVNLSRTDFDMGDALSRDRALTRAIARQAYTDGYQGVIYNSRLDARLDCWALFEGAQFEVLEISSIARDDKDLLAVAQLFRLRRAI